MTIPLPIAVEIRNDRIARHITSELAGVRFRNIAYGGFATASFALARPLIPRPDEVAYYGKVRITDGRSARVLWEGRLENPGPSAGADGPMWSLAAVGPSAHADDDFRPLMYADRRLDPWIVPGAAGSPNYLRIETRTDEDGTTVIQMQAGAGTSFLASAVGQVVNQAFAAAGLQLGRVSVGWRSGFTNASNDAILGSSVGAGAVTNVETDVMSSSSGTLVGSRGGANAIPASHDTPRLRWRRNTTALAGGDTIWIEFTNPVARQLLKTKAGVDIVTGYSADTVLGSEVVEDLLGRMLPKFDGTNATVSTTAYAINQLVYPDGVRARKVLDDVCALEPTMRWGAYESSAAGLHRFEFVAWPTTPRYEIDLTDGYDGDASADGLYNQARVRYVDPSGQRKTTLRTSSVAELTAAGLTRTLDVDLGDEVATLTDAQRAGDQALLDHQYPPNAGRLTVARRVLDVVSGRMVDPWEIMSGNLVRLRGLRPNRDALNPNGRDGNTILKIQGAEFDSTAAAAQLDLDSWPLSASRELAQVPARILRRR